MQEEYWAHRYIDKSFNDRYKFGYSADLGAQVIYDLTKWLSIDGTLMNGEGYTKLQSDNTLKGGIGLTIIPLKNFVIRGFYDISEKTVVQQSLATFLGYKIKNKVIAGFEYNFLFNEDFEQDHNRQGYSMYASWYPFSKIQIFGRYDKVYSNITDGESNPWNLPKDGSAIIAGIEYSPIKYLKIALDYQDWYPSAQNEPNFQYIFLDVEIKF
jgi:hypothetical protein